MVRPISILMPAYEPNPAHIREAVQSVLDQTHTEWTLLIHDDASTADVRSMISSFLDDPRITFRRSETRLGIGGNWNACLKHADSEYIQFLFQDDSWEPSYLEQAVKMIEANPSAGLVAVNHRYRIDGDANSNVYAEVTEARSKLQQGKHNGHQFLMAWSENGLRPNIIGEPSFVLLRKSVLDEVGAFREDMVQGLDMEMWIRILSRSDFCWIGDSLGSFRVHSKGASHQHERTGSGLLDRLLCFETLLRVIGKSDRGAIRKNLVTALQTMKQKYKNRTKSDGKGGLRMSALFGFALRHPLIALQSFLS